MQSKIKLQSEVLMIKSAGMKQSELEDIVAFDAYVDMVRDKYNIVLNTQKFKNRKKAWSDRLHEAAEVSPVMFDEKMEAEIKKDIADIVVNKGLSAIARYDLDNIKNMVEIIEKFTQ